MTIRLSNGSQQHINLDQKRFPADEKDYNFENYYAGILRTEYDQNSYWILNTDDVSKKYSANEANTVEKICCADYIVKTVVIYADKDGLCKGFQFIDANNRVLLREGQDQDSKKDGQQQFVTELADGERVIGHVWR